MFTDKYPPEAKAGSVGRFGWSRRNQQGRLGPKFGCVLAELQVWGMVSLVSPYHHESSVLKHQMPMFYLPTGCLHLHLESSLKGCSSESLLRSTTKRGGVAGVEYHVSGFPRCVAAHSTAHFVHRSCFGGGEWFGK